MSASGAGRSSPDFGEVLQAQELLPSAEDVAFYREHGWWISPVILSTEVLDAAERGMERYYAGDLDTEDAAWTAPPTEGLRKNDYASLHVRELAQLVAQPLIAATAARLAGADGIRLWHDQLLYKPVDAAGAAANVGWHTDRQYWQSCTSEEMLTAWVGFHDVDEEGGSVSFLDGSHRWDVSGLDFFAQDLAGLEARLVAQVVGQGDSDGQGQGQGQSQGQSQSQSQSQGSPARGLDIRPTRMRRGQVSFHHCRTVHGSGPNHGLAPRRSLAIHLQPGDNRYRPGTVGHGNDRLVRTRDGVPDYTDPDVCPRLWP